MIRVAIADDHARVRLGLAACIKVDPTLELVGEASNGHEAIALCRQLRPDVILLDLLMPGVDGATATRLIRTISPHTRIVVMSSLKDDELARFALRYGAATHITKDISANQLIDVLTTAERV